MAEQTDYHYSEQTWSCRAEGEPGEENGHHEAWWYCSEGGSHEQGVLWWRITKFDCEINCVEIA